MEYNFDTIDTVSNIIRGYDNWEDANFSSIILNEANLEGAELEATFLKEAHLKGARLAGASLEEASLRGAFLERAKLKEVCLYSMTNNSLLSGNGWGGKINGDIKDSSIFYNGWSSSNGDLRMVNDETTDSQLIQKCVELLSPAKTLFEATLPKPVEKVLREKYPHLFEPPA